MKYAEGRMCAANCRESGACSYKQMRLFCFLLQTFRHTVTNMHRGEDKLIGVGCQHKIGAGTAACTIKHLFEMLPYTVTHKKTDHVTLTPTGSVPFSS